MTFALAGLAMIILAGWTYGRPLPNPEPESDPAFLRFVERVDFVARIHERLPPTDLAELRFAFDAGLSPVQAFVLVSA